MFQARVVKTGFFESGGGRMHFPRTKEVDTEREKQAVRSLPGYEGRKEYEETGDCFFIEFDSNSISPGEVDYSDDF